MDRFEVKLDSLRDTMLNGDATLRDTMLSGDATLRDAMLAGNAALGDSFAALRGDVSTQISGLKDEIAAAKTWALLLYFTLAAGMLGTMARGFGWI